MVIIKEGEEMEKSEVKSPFSKVIQVGVVVRDVEKTVERLTSLGIGPFQEMVLPSGRVGWFRGDPMHADFKIYGGMIGGIQIELIQPLSGNSPHMEFLETKGEGFQHIACAVPDVQAAADGLVDQGCSLLMREIFPESPGVAYMDLGIGNIVVELIQRPAE
jgi:hypothetical protein